jgi:tetratricopeptide (TPR) repeat protein
MPAPGQHVETPDPVREKISRDLETNVLMQYAFSKAARFSRSGQLVEAAAEYGKLASAGDKAHLRALALVLQAEMLLRDPPTVIDTAGARAALERAHALGAPEREWTFTLGMLALREDRLVEARDLLRRSYSDDHQAQEAAAYLAVVEARAGDRAAGREWLELAREQAEAWRSPEAEIALRDPLDPAGSLRAAAAEHPDEYWLRLALARELTAAGRHDELVETTREMAADRDLPERFRAVAALGAARTLLLHAGDERIGEAMKLAAQARTLAPKSLAVWEVLALGYCRQGNFRRAAGAAKRVLKAEADSITARYVQAWALGARGMCDRARLALSDAVERDPEWPLRTKAADAVSGCR